MALATAAIVVVTVSLPELGVDAQSHRSIEAGTGIVTAQSVGLASPEKTAQLQAIEPTVDSADLTMQPIAGAQETADFETLIGDGGTHTGEDLRKAFALHDLCAGVPRGERDYQRWLEKHAAEVGFDFDLAASLFARCADVPIVFFERRVRIIETVAKRGDVEAQRLLGLSYPLGSNARSVWLLKAAQNGHANAYLDLAEQVDEVVEAGTFVDMRQLKWFLLSNALEIDPSMDGVDHAQLVASLTDQALDAYGRNRKEGLLDDMLLVALGME
ncbi:MAG: hypothetical protein AB8G17_05325 [Gammaproteobacteria bacterium]